MQWVIMVGFHVSSRIDQTGSVNTNPHPAYKMVSKTPRMVYIFTNTSCNYESPDSNGLYNSSFFKLLAL